MKNSEKIFSLIDLTDLSEHCNENSIIALCQKTAMDKTHVAAVCVWPAFVKTAARLLKNTPVAIATVANFPEGNHPLDNVLRLIHQAIRNGANEIDLVFPRQLFFSGDIKSVRHFLTAARNTCHEKILKVILETGAFPDLSELADACKILCETGADFLKTSTGKISPGATPEAANTLLRVIHDHSPQTGIKISSGVRNMDQALEYISLAQKIMGEKWMTPTHFRIGASQLIDDILCRHN